MEPLYVVTCCFNPRRYRRRYHLYHEFAQRLAKVGAKLITVEAAFWERPFEVTEPDNPNHVQVRTYDEIFNKENLLNLGFRRLPLTAKYVAWVDADITFLRDDWQEETVQKLQHHPIVQMWSNVLNMSPAGEPFQLWSSFGNAVDKRLQLDRHSLYSYFSHPGFAWACRVETLHLLGGLMDKIPLGSADSHIAGGLIGREMDTVHGGVTQSFKDYVSRWSANAFRVVKGDVGVVEGSIAHHWHGKMSKRRYKERWNIFIEHKFCPYMDMQTDIHGVVSLANNKPQLRYDIRNYLAERHEDETAFDVGEATIKNKLKV